MKTTKIKIGEIFEVEGVLYIIGQMKTPSMESDSLTKGQVVCPLIPIN